MLNVKDLEIQNIDHLGIVAGIVDAIGLVEIINNLLGSEPGERISAGQVVKAMILNGLGFVSQPLYMFPKFFETIACEHLIGRGVKPEYLNDDKLGRVMDKLYSKGLDTVFLAISLNTVRKFKVSLSAAHLDSTSIHVHGEYNYTVPEVIFESRAAQDQQEAEVKARQPIDITYGYSRDHRPDLKQFIIELICAGDGEIPIFMKAASGNQADSSCFANLALDYQKQIRLDSIIVADCALFTDANIKLMSNLKWLSRVPMTIKEAKFLCSSLASSEFTESQIKGYSFVEKEVTYAGVKQRWLVVQSEARRESDLAKLSKKINQVEASTSEQLKNLSQEKFACATDARKALSKISQKFKYHQIENIEITEKISKTKDKTEEKFYQILATICPNQTAINIEKTSAGRFILATNVVDDDAASLSNDEMISKYKAQQACERGFGFLKDPLFFADSVFLKSPERIESLAMIMGLCLLVYTLAQRQLRLALSSSKSTLKNQLGKLTNRPTLRWIFQCFQHIHLVTSQHQKEITNLTPERNFMLQFFPEDCHRYYNCAT